MNEPKCEGSLYRKKKGLKKYWFCIDKKELYCYESKEVAMHKSMHNLSGSFVKEEEPEKVDEMTLYPFVLVFSQIKSKRYYVSTKEEHKMWITAIRKVIGYANILDYYELKESLGKGKFGTVRAAVHKKTGKRVAIKVMKKSMMTPQDVELVKQEIEILKMCQHPNLIKMLDVFENIEHIYIVMELLEGGDLFSYLEKRKFKIPEQRASKIIHSLAAGLYYLHSYGIVHRDIKPENVLMATKAEDSDVKIVDFGLSKMVGPSQLCTEPFGTLSYVAPEVLQQKPYGKAVDVWSLGILAYLMMVGSLPFDHEDDREVARYHPFFPFFRLDQPFV
jgi:serine/threonine protein kinase